MLQHALIKKLPSLGTHTDMGWAEARYQKIRPGETAMFYEKTTNELYYPAALQRLSVRQTPSRSTSTTHPVWDGTARALQGPPSQLGHPEELEAQNPHHIRMSGEDNATAVTLQVHSKLTRINVARSSVYDTCPSSTKWLIVSTPTIPWMA